MLFAAFSTCERSFRTLLCGVLLLQCVLLLQHDLLVTLYVLLANCTAPALPCYLPSFVLAKVLFPTTSIPTRGLEDQEDKGTRRAKERV